MTRLLMAFLVVASVIVACASTVTLPPMPPPIGPDFAMHADGGGQ